MRMTTREWGDQMTMPMRKTMGRPRPSNDDIIYYSIEYHYDMERRTRGAGPHCWRRGGSRCRGRSGICRREDD
eukprot:3995259-Pyramimonas_sp.AAC.1